jgi:hypothetical protein
MTEAIRDLQQPVEDTVLLRDGEIELLRHPRAARRSTQPGNRTVQYAGVVIR